MKYTTPLKTLATAVLFLYAAAFVSADMINLSASQDNAIYQDNTANSNGAGDFLFAGRNGGGSARRSLIAFDLSALPTNAIIEQVTLTMFMSQSGAGDTNVTLHRLSADWGEGTSDAAGGEGGGTAAAAGDATWVNRFFPGDDWITAGGDFNLAASATTVVGGVGSYSWDSPSLVNDVQAWLDGDFGNFGWVLVGDESVASTAKRFNSRSNSQDNPVLSITFSTIPEPGCAIIMILVGSCSALNRRRRV